MLALFRFRFQSSSSSLALLLRTKVALLLLLRSRSLSLWHGSPRVFLLPCVFFPILMYFGERCAELTCRIVVLGYTPPFDRCSADGEGEGKSHLPS
jgi:hypothetical protein